MFAAVGALSHQAERAFSASVIYLCLGAAAAVGVEALGIPWVDPLQDGKVLERLSELAVVVALFATGLKLERELQPRQWRTVARLLLVAMPLTIAGVALFGVLAMGLSLGAAIALGAILAPTDPVLAGDIGVGPPGDEEEREPNFSITGEAGLNDSLAFPFLFLGIILADSEGPGWFGAWLLEDVLYGIAVAVATGAALGYGLAAAAVRLRDRGLMAPELDGWLAVAAVLVIYGATEIASAYGFLAAFVGGVAFRRYEHGHEYNARIHAGGETAEKFGLSPISGVETTGGRPRQASVAGERRRSLSREGAAVVLRAGCQAACSSRAERCVGSSRTLEFGPMTAATMRSMPSALARATAACVARAVSRSSTLRCHGASVRRSSPTIR